MLYSLLCYNDQKVTTAWTKEEDDAVMARLEVVHQKWAHKLKPAVRLMPTTAATTLYKDKNVVMDGPYVETKEALLGFYVLNCESLDEAIRIAGEMQRANPSAVYELRPIPLYLPGVTFPVTEADV